MREPHYYWKVQEVISNLNLGFITNQCSLINSFDYSIHTKATKLNHSWSTVQFIYMFMFVGRISLWTSLVTYYIPHNCPDSAWSVNGLFSNL